MSGPPPPVRQAVVRFLARELDEEGLRETGWAPGTDRIRWYASYGGGRPDQPYRQNGPSGLFTRHRGDRPTALYRLDRAGGWVLDAASGDWRPHDAPIRLHELAELSRAEVEALFALDDWGSWYFDYRIGDWVRTDQPRSSYYLEDLEIHEIDEAEAGRVATALGVVDALG